MFEVKGWTNNRLFHGQKLVSSFYLRHKFDNILDLLSMTKFQVQINNTNIETSVGLDTSNIPWECQKFTLYISVYPDLRVFWTTLLTLSRSLFIMSRTGGPTVGGQINYRFGLFVSSHKKILLTGFSKVTQLVSKLKNRRVRYSKL